MRERRGFVNKTLTTAPRGDLFDRSPFGASYIMKNQSAAISLIFASLVMACCTVQAIAQQSCPHCCNRMPQHYPTGPFHGLYPTCWRRFTAQPACPKCPTPHPTVVAPAAVTAPPAKSPADAPPRTSASGDAALPAKTDSASAPASEQFSAERHPADALPAENYPENSPAALPQAKGEPQDRFDPNLAVMALPSHEHQTISAGGRLAADPRRPAETASYLPPRRVTNVIPAAMPLPERVISPLSREPLQQPSSIEQAQALMPPEYSPAADSSGHRPTRPVVECAQFQEPAAATQRRPSLFQRALQPRLQSLPPVE